MIKLPMKVKTATHAELKRFWARWVEEVEAAHAALDTERYERATRQVKKIEAEIKRRKMNF